MDTDAVEYEVRTAGTADYILRSADFFSRMPVICLECGERTGLTLTARGEDNSIGTGAPAPSTAARAEALQRSSRS
ncbi:hypothetical protein [Streptomyces sp. NPDC050164]|uniref:hypothetical protein n=1 Tax=Streptomyces sp. NPDC050164 TaxID=3365605 RepID=UPI0037AB4F54